MKMTRQRRNLLLTLLWLVPLLYTTFGFYRMEEVRNERSRDIHRQTEQVCDAVEAVRNAVIAGQDNAQENPIPIPEVRNPDVAAAMAEVITFVNTRQGISSAAVLAEVDKARCPASLRGGDK